MFLVAPLSTRNQFGPFLKERGLTGDAVEIGTHRADFAQVLLTYWPGRLFCIDPWENLPGYGDQAKYLWGTGNREEDFQAAKEALSPYLNRAMFMRSTSEQAVVSFADDSLDFVYVDGNHYSEYVLQDLQLWWPKLRSGGVMAGHDIVCPGPAGVDNWGRHIQPAVSSFMLVHNIDVYLVVEEGGLPWSYYMVKP